MAGAKELELEIDVTYEDDEDDTAVMPLVAIRELLRQEALAAGKSSYVKPDSAYRIQEVFAKSR